MPASAAASACNRSARSRATPVSTSRREPDGLPACRSRRRRQRGATAGPATPARCRVRRAPWGHRASAIFHPRRNGRADAARKHNGRNQTGADDERTSTLASAVSRCSPDPRQPGSRSGYRVSGQHEDIAARRTVVQGEIEANAQPERDDKTKQPGALTRLGTIATVAAAPISVPSTR